MSPTKRVFVANGGAAKPNTPACVPGTTGHLALDPKRSAAPQGFVKFVPNAELQKIADAAEMPLDSLGVLTISHTACELWSAITAYLCLSPVPAGQPAVQLHVKQCYKLIDDDAVVGGGGSESGSDDEDDDDAAKRPVLPEFELAPSTTKFVWPPPAHLAAKEVLDRHGGVQKAVTSDDFGAAPSAEAREEDTRQVLHLFYYHIGGPLAVYENIKIPAEMLLVATSGTRALTRFCEEVLEWHGQVTKPQDLMSRFPLYRLKVRFGDGRWVNEGLKRARPADSVILPGDQMDVILGDVEKFRSASARNWYFRHGLPYRRSYLFFGPPGTGKTSTVRVIASRFGLTCCALSMANQEFSNQTLGDALSRMPKSAMLVLEDVDALFNEERESKVNNALTFSGLLNALDGLASVEGLVTVMTTNHIERLEKALVRGGRVDRRFRFDLPGRDELAKLFSSFYPAAADGVGDRFVRAIMSRREGAEARAVSTLQQLFIEMREQTAEECVSGVDDFFERYFPDDGRKTGLSSGQYI